MTNKAIAIGQIGVGYWGPNILRNLNANSLFAVRAVADLSPERREFVNKNYPSVIACASADEIINNPEIEAVVVATPVNTHFELATRALNAGKHVLVEKPMAQTVDEVSQIGLLARQKNLVAMVGHTFLFSPAVRMLRQIIDQGELGQIRYLYCRRLNLGRIRSDVDALWNLAPHDISIIQYLFGDPSPINVAYSGMDYIQRGIDDVSFVNITYPNRVMANIHVSWLDPQRARSITVVGSDRMAVFDDTAKDKLVVYDKGIDRMAVLGQNMDYDTTTRPVFNERSGNSKVIPLSDKEPLSEEMTHFAACIRQGEECLTGPDHALRVVKILSACRRGTQILVNEGLEISTSHPPSPDGQKEIHVR